MRSTLLQRKALEQDQQTFLRRHAQYERRAFRILRKTFRDLALGLPVEKMRPANYQALVELNIPDKPIQDAVIKIWTETGLTQGRRVIRDLQKELEELGQKNRPLFDETFAEQVRKYLMERGGYRMRLIAQSYRGWVTKLIGNAMQQEFTPDDLTDALYARFRSRGFYRWQMARIARTETTGAMNYGTMTAGETVQIQQQKIWITARDERVRRLPEDSFSHRALHEKKLDKDIPFEMPGKRFTAKLQFPGDPNVQPRAGTAGAVINCRCSVGVVAARDQNGRLRLRQGVRVPPLQPQQAPQVQAGPGFQFVPPKSRAEAVRRIKAIGATKAKLDGLKPEQYTAVLRALEEENAIKPLSKLASVVTYRDRSAWGPVASYNSYTNEIKINLKQLNAHFQPLKTHQEVVDKYTRLLERYNGYLGNRGYDQREVRQWIRKFEARIADAKAQKARMAEGIPPKYFGVPESVDDPSGITELYRTVIHELGHYRHFRDIGSDRLFGFPKGRIVGRYWALTTEAERKIARSMAVTEYGETNWLENFAEWFTFYRVNPARRREVPEEIRTAIETIIDNAS